MGKTWQTFVDLNRFAVHELFTGHATQQAWRTATSRQRVMLGAYLGACAAVILAAVALVAITT